MNPGEWDLTPLRLDTVVYPDWHPRTGEVGPVYAYLLRNVDQVVLTDTGIGPRHPLIDRLYQPTRRDPVEVLKQECGIDPADIDAIVLSHLHFDHVGGAQGFPGTPLYVQHAEWEAAQAPKYTVPEFLTFTGANFAPIDGDLELFPGLRLIVTAGHTPGHQLVAVSTTTGLVVLAGQAIETRADLEAMLAGSNLSPAAERLMSLDPSRVYFSHDDAVWERGHVNRPGSAV